MELNYKEFFKAFWAKRLSCRLTGNEVDMYLFLLHECELNGWSNPFNVLTQKCEVVLCIRRKNVSSAREGLQEKGFIKFIPSMKRGEVAQYEIIGLEAFLLDGQPRNEGLQKSGGSVPRNIQTQILSDFAFHIGTQKGTQKGTQNFPSLQCIENEKFSNLGVNNDSGKQASEEPSGEKETEKETKKKQEKVSPTPLLKEKEINKEKDKEKEGWPPKILLTTETANIKEPQKEYTLCHRARLIFENFFQSQYEGELYYWQAKDAKAMNSIIKKITYSRKNRTSPLPVDDESLLEAWRTLLSEINKDWIKRNFSVNKIDSLYNEIISEIKNRNKSQYGNNNRIGWKAPQYKTDEELETGFRRATRK